MASWLVLLGRSSTQMASAVAIVNFVQDSPLQVTSPHVNLPHPRAASAPDGARLRLASGASSSAIRLRKATFAPSVSCVPSPPAIEIRNSPGIGGSTTHPPELPDVSAMSILLLANWSM